MGTPTVYPQAVPKAIPYIVYDFFNNVGGLNDGFGATAIEDNEASTLQNVVFTTGGFVKRRTGTVDVNSSASFASGAITGIINYKQTDGTKFIVGIGADDTVRKQDYSGGEPDGVWDDITGSVSFAAGADDQADFAAAEGNLFFTPGLGTGPILLWTGAGNATTLDATPSTSILEYHKLHLWAAGDTANPSRVYFSALDGAGTFTLATDFLQFDTDDGSVVQAIVRGLDSLYVFKDFSIHRVSGTDKDNFRTERMVQGIGTTSGQAVKVINNQFVFPTTDGRFAVYNGGITVQFISDPIQGTLDGLNLTRFDELVAVNFNDDYLVSVTAAGSSTHNRMLFFDTLNQAWSVFKGLNANSIAIAEFGEGTFEVIFGDYGGLSKHYPSGDDDAGTAVDAFYTSKWFRFPLQPNFKNMKLAKVFVDQLGTGINITVETRVDFEASGKSTTVSLAGTGSLWDTMIWDTDNWGGDLVIIERIEVNQKDSTFFQIHFETNDTNAPWTIRGFQLWIEQSGQA